MTIIWYLYGVAGADDVTGIELPSGIGGAPLEAMVAGDLAAAVSGVDPALFDAAQADPELDERGRLADALRAHNRVVRTIFALIPVVPLRFGALVAGREGVEKLLATECERLHAALEMARETAEWRVRVILHDPSEVDSRWQGLIGRIHSILSVYAVDTNGAVPVARDVYLVRRRDENAFSTAAFALAGLLSGTPVEVEISGPAPPYHFMGGGPVEPFRNFT